MKLVYFIDKPDYHPLHCIAHDLGFVRSGWVGWGHIINPHTLEMNRYDIEAEFDRIDARLEPGLPLIPDTERWGYILRDGSGPIPAWDWLQRNRSLALYLRQRFLNRLIGTWGLRIGVHDVLNKLYRDSFTCGVISIYRRDGWLDARWRFLVTQRYEQTLEAGHPIHLDAAPVIWQRGGQPRSDARAATSREWRQMVDLLGELNPRWAGLWLRDGIKGVTDAFIEKAFVEMAKELG